MNAFLELIQTAQKFIRQQMELGEREFISRGAPFGTQGEPSSMASPVAASPASQTLETFYESIRDCRKCPLGKLRTHLVFGAGNPDADVMFIGEAPGVEEDLRGAPFVGRAGQLLTKIIEAIRLTREEVYIANILKCRPPKNRDPEPEEVVQCEPHLIRQIELIRPKIICALGRIAGQTLLKTSAALGSLRGKVHRYQGIKLIVTYHPAALLRNPQWKRPTWEDMKRLRREYDGVEL